MLISHCFAIIKHTRIHACTHARALQKSHFASVWTFHKLVIDLSSSAARDSWLWMSHTVLSTPRLALCLNSWARSWACREEHSLCFLDGQNMFSGGKVFKGMLFWERRDSHQAYRNLGGSKHRPTSAWGKAVKPQKRLLAFLQTCSSSWQRHKRKTKVPKVAPTSRSNGPEMQLDWLHTPLQRTRTRHRNGASGMRKSRLTSTHWTSSKHKFSYLSPCHVFLMSSLPELQDSWLGGSS